MIRPLAALGLVVLALSGCTRSATYGTAAPVAEGPAEPAASVGTAITEVPPPPPPLPKRRPREEHAAALVPPRDLHVDDLLGLDLEATEALLGAPAVQEVQAPARVWAYNGARCVLSIFFYPNVEGTSYRALTYEVTGSDESEDRANRCFWELLAEHEQTLTN